MSTHVAPYQWLDPRYEHWVDEEPDSLDTTTYLLYDHLMGRVGSEMSLHLAGASSGTSVQHRTDATLVVSEQQVARLAAAGAGYVGVRLECRRARHKFATESDDLSAEMNATLRSELSVIIFPGQPDRESNTRHHPTMLTAGPELFVVTTEMVARQREPGESLVVDAQSGDIRRVVFRLEDLSGWDRHESLILGICVTNTIDLKSDDFNIGVEFVSEWIVSEVLVETIEPYKTHEQKPPPPP